MPNTTNTSSADARPSRRRGGGRSGTVRGRASYRTGSFEVFTYPHHSMPALVLGAVWRWRIELLIVMTVLVAWVVLAYQLPETWPTWVAPLVLVAMITVIAVVPPCRRFVSRRFWCVFSRHRVRKCFVQSRVMTHEGLLPLFMWTRPTPVGERLWLWLRPGLSSRDIDNVTDRIAAACWAASARVKVSPKRAAVVSVEVIRRDPLATSGQIASPLLDGVHLDHFESDAGIIPLPDRSTVTPPSTVQGHSVPGDVPSVDSAPARAGTVKRASTRAGPPAETTTSSTAGVLGWSGKDVSDYV
jgi:hypothetical protein